MCNQIIKDKVTRPHNEICGTSVRMLINFIIYSNSMFH